MLTVIPWNPKLLSLEDYNYLSMKKDCIASTSKVGNESELKSQADPMSLKAPPMKPKVEYLQSSVTIRYEKKLRRITLHRYLLSKIYHFPDTLLFSDLLVLYDNQISLIEYSNLNPQFREKFGIFLEKINEILKESKITEKNVLKKVHEMKSKIKEGIEEHIFPKRNMSSIRLYVRNKFHIISSRSLGIPTKELPQKAYIGVGYKDKGNRRDPAYDGSPSWQEVAQFLSKGE
jgi:hypothetical protein